MWYVCDVLYAVLYARASCFVVRGCAVSRRYINVCNCEYNEPTSCLVQPLGTHGCEVMYFWCVYLRGELGLSVCMCVVDKQFELVEFVFDPVYVDLQYDEISLTFTAGFVSLWCVCSHVVVFGLSVSLSWYPMWMRWYL